MKVERWKKVFGKHHAFEDGVKKIYGPGQEDGDIVTFPAGQGPKESPSWLLIEGAGVEVLDFENGPVVKALGRGWFNVINPETGKPINTVKLRRADADALAEEWEADNENDDDPEGGEEEPVCPVEDGTFGEDFEDYDECAECEFAVACEAKENEDDGDGKEG